MLDAVFAVAAVVYGFVAVAVVVTKASLQTEAGVVVYANMVSYGVLVLARVDTGKAPAGSGPGHASLIQITTRLSVAAGSCFESFSVDILLLTGAALETGRTHEMWTRAPFLKTSAIPVSQNRSLEGQSAPPVNQN